MNVEKTSLKSHFRILINNTIFYRMTNAQREGQLSLYSEFMNDAKSLSDFIGMIIRVGFCFIFSIICYKIYLSSNGTLIENISYFVGMLWSAGSGLALITKLIRIIYVYLLIGVVKEDTVLLKLIAIGFSAVMGIALARAIVGSNSKWRALG